MIEQDSGDNELHDTCYEKIYQSSGGVLVQRLNGTLYYLAVLQKRVINGDLQWVSPKGRIEANESTLETAKREIAEEVGLKNITLIDFISEQCVCYKELGKLYKKTIFWYLFHVNDPTELLLNEEEGFIESKWLTYEESLSMYSHENFIEVVKLANNILKKSVSLEIS